MSCDITKGRLSNRCKEGIAGLIRVFFINNDTVDQWTMDTDETITGVLPAAGGIEAYQYDLHMGNDLTQNIQSSPENGTLYFEQVLSLTLKKLSSIDNSEINKIARGNPYVLVEDQLGNIMLAGRERGMDVTGGTAVTGNDYGDFHGYTLVLTGREKTLANFMNSSYDPFETDFTKVLGTV